MSPDQLHPTVAAMLQPFMLYAVSPRVQVVGADCIHCGCPDQTDAPCEGCAALDAMHDRYVASQQEAC
jgi:hypothetical protein